MHVVLAVIYSELERLEEARAKVADILKMDPNYTIAEFAKAVPAASRSAAWRSRWARWNAAAPRGRSLLGRFSSLKAVAIFLSRAQIQAPGIETAHVTPFIIRDVQRPAPADLNAALDEIS